MVFNTGGDPVALGLVASLNRPGANVTGSASLEAELGPKRLQLLRELIPNSAVFGVLADPAVPSVQSIITDLQAAARTLGSPIEGKMISIGRSLFFFLVALLVPAAFAVGQPVSMTWPEAVAQLTGERTKAETCISLVKKHGNEIQIARGQLAYANAKGDSDAVIAGLITALSAGQQPASLSSLQGKLSRGVSGHRIWLR
jgi:hypothetical protein